MIANARLFGLGLVVSLYAVPNVAHAQCISTANGLQCFGSDVQGQSTNANAARAGFLSSLTGVGTETFQGLSGSSPFLLTFPGAGNATLGAGAEVTTDVGFGRYPVSGTRYLEATSSQSGASTFNITFGGTVAAFGFFGTDIGDFGSQLTLRFTLANGLGTVDWTLPYVATNGTGTARDGSLLYAGFIDTRGFTAVQFRGTSDDDVFGFDDMTIGSLEQINPDPQTVVPEPGTYALMAAGLAGLAVMSRRRRAT
jgi:hypothetical protein